MTEGKFVFYGCLLLLCIAGLLYAALRYDRKRAQQEATEFDQAEPLPIEYKQDMATLGLAVGETIAVDKNGQEINPTCGYCHRRVAVLNGQMEEHDQVNGRQCPQSGGEYVPARYPMAVGDEIKVVAKDVPLVEVGKSLFFRFAQGPTFQVPLSKMEEFKYHMRVHNNDGLALAERFPQWISNPAVRADYTKNTRALVECPHCGLKVQLDDNRRMEQHSDVSKGRACIGSEEEYHVPPTPHSNSLDGPEGYV